MPVVDDREPRRRFIWMMCWRYSRSLSACGSCPRLPTDG